MERVIGARTIIKHEEKGYYRTIKGLHEDTGSSINHIRSLLNGIREQIKLGRYNRYAILDGGELRVNVYVYFDYDKYRKQLADRIQKKYVPAFNPDEIAEICPVREKIIVIEEEMSECVLV